MLLKRMVTLAGESRTFQTSGCFCVPALYSWGKIKKANNLYQIMKNEKIKNVMENNKCNGGESREWNIWHTRNKQQEINKDECCSLVGN